MRFRPPFYRQETPDSCVPACLRMVLAGLGVDLSEAELRGRCDCSIFGTEALQAVKASRDLGFDGTWKENLAIAQLQEVVERKVFPIVYVNLMPIDQVRAIHAVVVVGMDESSAMVLDPLVGERLLSRAMFEAAFQLTNGLTIVVTKE